jgi:hypothetical protein
MAELTAAALAEVYPDELNHVWLQQVHVPPGRLLHLQDQRAREVCTFPKAFADFLIY